MVGSATLVFLAREEREDQTCANECMTSQSVERQKVFEGVSFGDYMSSLKGKKVVVAFVKGVAKVLRVMGIRDGLWASEGYV